MLMNNTTISHLRKATAAAVRPRPAHVPMLMLVVLAMSTYVAAMETTVEDAWKGLPSYEYGQDMVPLLIIDRVVIQALAAPDTRAACAARLGSVLAADSTSMAARKYICLQLRQVGTSAEVPLLARMLVDPETSEMARQALQSIPGEKSATVLRSVLTTVQGKALIGVMNSLGARKDALAVEALQRLADSPDKLVVTAAFRALGSIATDQASAFLLARAAQAGTPTPSSLAVPLLRSAEAKCKANQTDWAQEVFAQLSQKGQAAGTRRAALEGILRLTGKVDIAKVLVWFADTDPDRRRVAASHLRKLNDQQLDQLLTTLAKLPESSQVAVIELAASRRGNQVLAAVMKMGASESPEVRLAGIRTLGVIGDPAAIPLLLNALSSNDPTVPVAQDALAKLPRQPVTVALLESLQSRVDMRVPVIAVLEKLRCYEAIEPLIEIASDSDPAVYGPALDGLRGIADPDKADIPRLVGLLLKVKSGRHRDEVEKTILIVSEKLPPDRDRSELVIASLKKFATSDLAKSFSLLGRLGGATSLEMIRSGLASEDPSVREAAVRGLCNWPNADVADELLELANNSKNKSHRRWSLRAYIRVVTLKSDRPESETLAMLQNAMQLAETTADKQLAVTRASTIRTMETVDWIALFLDDPKLAQAACLALVELAHHRFLRHPSMPRFEPILKKVGNVSKDPAVVERAKRYRLGL